MDLQFPTAASHSAATAAASANYQASPQKASPKINPTLLGPLSIIASFAERSTLSAMGGTSRSWRIVARKIANVELLKELNLFYEVLIKVIKERSELEELYFQSTSAETESMIRGIELLETLISSTAQEKFSLPSDLPAITHSLTTKSLHQFACSRTSITFSQQFVGECLDFLNSLKIFTLKTLQQKLREAPPIEWRTDLLGRRLVSGFDQRRDVLEINYTPFTDGLIELALRMKEVSPGIFNSNLSDAEWIQAELYRLARCIENKNPITLTTWQLFYRELFTKRFFPVRLSCTFDPTIRGIPSGFRPEEDFKASLKPALTPFLAVIPPTLRDNKMTLPCYTPPAFNFPEADTSLLEEIAVSEEIQLNLYVRFTLCVNILQNIEMDSEDHFRATVVLILDLLKYSRDLRCPRQGKRHYLPYQFSEPLNFLEELMVKALNNLPNKKDRLDILCKIPHHFGSRTKESISFLCALASQTREMTQQDIEDLRSVFTQKSSSVQRPPADASALDQNNPSSPPKNIRPKRYK